MVSCLVISHGKVARAFIDTCEQITGHTEALYTIDCNHLTAKALYQQISALIEKEKLFEGLLILVGLRGGSCWNVAAKIAGDYPKIEVISGLNLSLVLSFATKRDKFSFEELKEVVYEDGRRGITKLGKH